MHRVVRLRCWWDCGGQSLLLALVQYNELLDVRDEERLPLIVRPRRLRLLISGVRRTTRDAVVVAALICWPAGGGRAQNRPSHRLQRDRAIAPRGRARRLPRLLRLPLLRPRRLLCRLLRLLWRLFRPLDKGDQLLRVHLQLVRHLLYLFDRIRHGRRRAAK